MGILATMFTGAVLVVFSSLLAARSDRLENVVEVEPVMIESGSNKVVDGENIAAKGAVTDNISLPAATNREEIEFPRGETVEVCGMYWISAILKYDESSRRYSTIEVTMPDASEVSFNLVGSTPIEIAPGCVILSGREREHRPGRPDAALTIQWDNR